jgi:hypothetical protein
MSTTTDEPRAHGTGTRTRRNLALNVVVYLVMNAFFVAGWSPNLGKPLPEGFFWPIIPIVAWGLGLAIYGWIVLRGDGRSGG